MKGIKSLSFYLCQMRCTDWLINWFLKKSGSFCFSFSYSFTLCLYFILFAVKVWRNITMFLFCLFLFCCCLNFTLFVKMLFCQRYLFHVQVSLQSDSSTNIWWSLQENIRGVSSELVNLKLNQEKDFAVLLFKERGREEIIFSMQFGVDKVSHLDETF